MAEVIEFDPFVGEQSPLSTNWSTLSGYSACLKTGGAAYPTTFSSACGVLGSQTLTVIDTSSEYKGVQVRWTLTGGFESGTVLTGIWGATDANNYYYWKLELDSVSVLSNLTRHSLKLYKRVSGVDTELTADGLGYLQLTQGDLRFQALGEGTVISIVHCYQSILLCINDRVFRRLNDATKTPTGRFGFTFPATTSHTTGVTRVQAQVLDTRWSAPTGSDTTGVGSRQNPWQTAGKLYQGSAKNRALLLKTGTYSQTCNMVTLGVTTSGTDGLPEDWPIVIGDTSGTATIAGNPSVFGDGTNGFKRWQWTNLDVTQTGLSDSAFKLLRRSYQHFISFFDVHDTSGQGILMTPDSGLTDFLGKHEVWDCTFVRCGQRAGGLDHDIYCSVDQLQFRYNQLDGTLSEGYGVHCFSGSSGGVGTAGAIVEYNLVFNHLASTRSGIILAQCPNGVARYNIVHTNTRGITVSYDSVNAKVYGNWIYDSTFMGIGLGGFGTTSGTKVFNNTIVNTGGYAIFGETGNTGAILKNNHLVNNSNTIGGVGIATNENNVVGALADFVNAAGKDFQIVEGSLAQGAGQDLSAEGISVDLHGSILPQNSLIGWPVGATDVPAAGVVPLSKISTTTLSFGVQESVELIGPPEETILKVNIGVGERYRRGILLKIYWFHDPLKDVLQQSVPFVTIKISADDESTYEQVITNVPNVVGWNSYGVLFKVSSSQYRILISDAVRDYVLTRGVAVFTVADRVQVRGSV